MPTVATSVVGCQWICDVKKFSRKRERGQRTREKKCETNFVSWRTNITCDLRADKKRVDTLRTSYVYSPALVFRLNSSLFCICTVQLSLSVCVLFVKCTYETMRWVPALHLNRMNEICNKKNIYWKATAREMICQLHKIKMYNVERWANATAAATATTAVDVRHWCGDDKRSNVKRHTVDFK